MPRAGSSCAQQLDAIVRDARNHQRSVLGYGIDQVLAARVQLRMQRHQAIPHMLHVGQRRRIGQRFRDACGGGSTRIGWAVVGRNQGDPALDPGRDRFCRARLCIRALRLRTWVAITPVRNRCIGQCRLRRREQIGKHVIDVAGRRRGRHRAKGIRTCWKRCECGAGLHVQAGCGVGEKSRVVMGCRQAMRQPHGRRRAGAAARPPHAAVAGFAAARPQRRELAIFGIPPPRNLQRVAPGSGFGGAFLQPGARTRQRAHHRVERFRGGRAGTRMSTHVFSRGEPAASSGHHAGECRCIIDGVREHHGKSAADAVRGRSHHADPRRIAAHARHQREAPNGSGLPRCLPVCAETVARRVDGRLERGIPGRDETRRQAPLHEVAHARQLAEKSRAAETGHPVSLRSGNGEPPG